MRTVPHLIDRSSRIGEYAMCFLVPLFMLRTVDPLFALGAAALLAGVFIKYTFGKPPGYLVHLTYRRGVPLTGLLDVRVTRYVI
ncbi:MAG TPA: hypothetical protein VMQ45_02995 [Burkholderiaceae bacterium]|nr:hypothetical protein [Burkholderiaceae bacterium]